VFLENVNNHLRIGYDAVRQELQEIGYCVEQGIFSAEEVGASHLRKRLFILGYNNEFDVADTASGGRGVLREPSRTARQLDGQDKNLADSCCGFVSQPWRETEVGNGIGSTSTHVDNSMRRRRWPQDEAVCARGGGSVNASSNMGNADDLPVDTRRLLEEMVYDTSLFPPGPDEKEKWIEILEIEPTLEPALRMLADGMAPGMVQSLLKDRTLQLRLLGNGVVPACAAFAFGVLLGHLFPPEHS
jgi:DNA (cytosine-5)-methyltransferase 1